MIKSSIKPNGIEALNNKAFALANLDKNEGALAIIEKASGLDSNDVYSFKY
jgi:hypothetical protein